LKLELEERKQAGLEGDLLFASGSGLDPEISPESAEYQVPRIARALNWPEQRVMDLVRENTKSRQFGILGEARVNVLMLNLAIEASRR